VKIYNALKNLTVITAKKAIKGYLIKVSFIILAVIVCVGSVFKVISYGSSRYACHTQWQESGIDYKYTLRGGCLIKRGPGWVPAKNFRVE